MNEEEYKAKAKFHLGRVISTMTVARSVPPSIVRACLDRHVTGDWGLTGGDDAAINNEAVKTGDRIMSTYPINPNKPCAGHGDNCLWVITEGGVTTVLLPSDY